MFFRVFRGESFRSIQFAMPILSHEPDCYPSDLFDAERPPADDPARRWWLVYTRSRREKDLMRRLLAARIWFYGPVVARRQRSPSGRVRESFVPLFSGYVFLYGSEEDRRTALTTNCISTMTSVADEGRLFTELARVARLVATNVPITPEERLESGQAVRVASGPLKGQEGIVIQRRGKRRLLVAIDLLQQGASVDLDECDVQAL